MIMKILIINYEYPPLGGGSGVASKHLITEYKKNKNLKIDLVTSSTDKYQVEKFSENISITKLNVGKKNNNLHHQSFYNLVSYLVKSTVWVIKNKDKYDLIHAFGGIPAGIPAFISGKPYIVSLRGGEQPGYEPRFDKLLNLIKPLLKVAYEKAQSIDANSQYLKKLTLKSFPKLKIKVIRNGVNLKQFYPAKRQVAKPIILCTSRFGDRKGVWNLIKAMKHVVIKIPEAKLVLTGEGEREKEIRQKVKVLKLTKSVRFKGRVGHEEMPEIYRQASLFVLPSLSESMSNSLLEAMACGLPVVATKVGGNSELVSNNGFLVPPKNSQKIAKEIIRVLKSKKKANAMGKTSRELAKKFSDNKMAENYLDIYSKISL